MAKLMWSGMVAMGMVLSLAACGGNDKESDRTTGSGTGGSATGAAAGSGAGETGGSGSGTTEGCPNHPAVVEGSSGECRVSASLTAPMTEDLTMDAGNVWYLDGPLVVGNDADLTTLTLQAGTTVFGGDGSFILVQRGSKIMAEGTALAPIVLTSAKDPGSRGPEDWGGLVINGKAPINNAANADGSAPGEAGTGSYGGNDPSDDSGVLKYVRVEFA